MNNVCMFSCYTEKTGFYSQDLTTVFPEVMYGFENWTVKKAECRRIGAFELWLEKTRESLGLQGDPTSPF